MQFKLPPSAGIPWLPVVLGTLLGLVLLILLVILCIFILCCRGRGKNTIIEDSPEHDSSRYYRYLKSTVHQHE